MLRRAVSDCWRTLRTPEVDRRRRYSLMLVAVAWLGFLAAFEKPLAERRPTTVEFSAGVEFLVTSPKDGGPGSLREAIFAADQAQTRARVRILARRVVLETPLPPLINPDGIVIEAPDPGTEIDARALPEEAVLDLAAPGSVVYGLRIRGAAGSGILVRAGGMRLRKVGLLDCGVGVQLAEGVDDVVVEESSFDENGTGVRVAEGASASVSRNAFRKQDQAGVWAVASAPPREGTTPAVVLRQNQFEDDRISVVLINVAGQVEENRFARPGEAAVYLSGPGLVRRNRIQAGSRVGMYVDAADGALIEENELDHNVAVGVLLRQSRRAGVLRNRVYENGYGIVVVFGDQTGPNVIAENLVLSQRADGLYVVGGSPVLRANRAVGNRGAGLRVLDYVPLRGPRITGHPLLQDNVLQDNGSDSLVRGEYREPRDRRETR
jgi:Periplasmic copper-binding protein (NosD)